MEIEEKQVKESRNLNEKLVKKENGITLVALVITVVIMLILAGVAIAAVIDGDGLFSKTREATEVYENAAGNENDTIQSLMNEIDIYLENPNNPVIKEPAEIGTIMSENQTLDGRVKGTYSNPIIPKGFAAINENGADWGTETGYQKGLVITDKVDQDGQSIGNEFVWVPVDGKIVKFERIEWGTGFYKKDECEEIVPEEIATSVIQNGGFYIARFEGGKPEGVTLLTDGSVRPVSKQGAEIWNEIPWGEVDATDNDPGNGAVTVARSMYSTESVNYGAVSTLIYGTQWDTALKFIGAYNIGEAGYDTYAVDSTGMGNYGGIEASCGEKVEYKQKNIYDMAGNAYELTMEKHSTSNVIRGGNYNYSSVETPASERGDVDIDYLSASQRFSRSSLYKIII